MCITLGFTRLAAKDRKTSNILGNHNSDSCEYCPEHKQRQPKCPHWQIPCIVHGITQPITKNEADSNSYNVFHRSVKRIVSRVKKGINTKRGEPYTNQAIPGVDWSNIRFARTFLFYGQFWQSGAELGLRWVLQA